MNPIKDTPSQITSRPPSTVCPDPHVHESRLVKSPTPACRRSKPSLSLLVVADASTSRASIDRVARASSRRRRRRVRVARANDRANENPLVPSTPRARSRRRRPRERERDPTIDEPSIDDSRARRDGPRGESAIGRRDRARAMRENSSPTTRGERIDANKRTMGSIDRRVASSRVRVSRMSARMTRTNE